MRIPRARSVRRLVGPVAGLLLAGTVVLSGPAGAQPAASQGKPARASHARTSLLTLPAPPRPPAGRPHQPGTTAGGHPAPVAPGASSRSTAATTTSTASATAVAAAVVPPATARTFGAVGPASTLVLYDSTGAYGWLGELYALGGGTLATHFGRVTAEPVTDYVAGQVADFTATVYFGSTYDEALPAALLADLRTTDKPVIWSGFNVWQLSGATGTNTNAAFQAKYGWDAATSYIDTADAVTSVAYHGQTFTRNAANQGGVLAPNILDATKVSVLAQGGCSDSSGAATPCTGAPGGTLPWAVRSANLTYVGEIPLSYISESDRYVIYADLLFPALAPAATPSHRGLVRLEDVNPTSDPATLRAFADYLSSQGVPFSVGVIPVYTDPNGAYNGGTAEKITLARAPAVVSALKYMQSKGGTLIQHGGTHQYSNVANPYNAVTADDFEFYRSRCSTTSSAPYTFTAPCANTDYVVLLGALPNDSVASASRKVTTGQAQLVKAGLAKPTIFETPHYSATAADYAGMQKTYRTRYERELFFGGQLTTGTADTSRVFGQFFPYVVNDIYGTKVLPENLGNYEPVTSNNNPPRLPAQIVYNAQVNLAVTQGVASFFFHPDYPLAQLQQTVAGIKGLGYTFVAPTAMD